MMTTGLTEMAMDKRRRWLIAGILTALVISLGGIGGAYAYTPDIPRGVKVLGIAVGGMSRGEARAALQAALADRVNQPVHVKIQDRAVDLNPGDIGLSVDVDATVTKAAGHNRIAALFGRDNIEPVVNIDGKALVAALKPTAEAMGAPATMPAIRFQGLDPQPVYPVRGKGLDIPTTTAIVTGSWLREPEAVVPIVDVVPAGTAADVDRLLAELALPAVAAGVTIDTDKGPLTAAPEVIAASLIIDSDEMGKLTPHVDEKALRAALQPELAKVEVAPQSASVGDGQILASSGGLLVDTAKLATDLMQVLPKAPERTLHAGFKQVEPETTSAKLAALGITEQVSTFTTHFSGGLNYGRSINIITGANKVDGAVVKPGETFSLNEFTGPRGYEQGYKDAPVIMNGKLEPGVGGGMSQFTTTLFNAAYYAGLEDIHHQPHTIYFSSYPSVIEATIFYPNLDLKFRNNTEHSVLIDTSYTEDSITVSMWSTKVYDSVRTEWSAKRDFTEPEEIESSGSACIARPGSQGFSQDAWRVFEKGGKEVRREKFSWRYDAEPRVTCRGRN